MNEFQKRVLRLFQPKIEKKVSSILNDSVLHYEIVKKAVELIIKQKDAQIALNEASKLGISFDNTTDKIAVYIINSLRKKGVYEELTEFILSEIDKNLK